MFYAIDLILNINFSSSYSNISCNNYALLNNFPVYARLVKCYELHAWVILPSHSETFWRQTTCVKVYNTSKNHLNTVVLLQQNLMLNAKSLPPFFLFFLAWYEVIISLFKDLKIYPKFFVSYKKDLEASFHLFFMPFRTLIFIILITAKQQKFIFHVLAFFSLKDKRSKMITWNTTFCWFNEKFFNLCFIYLLHIFVYIMLN